MFKYRRFDGLRRYSCRHGLTSGMNFLAMGMRVQMRTPLGQTMAALLLGTCLALGQEASQHAVSPANTAPLQAQTDGEADFTAPQLISSDLPFQPANCKEVDDGLISVSFSVDVSGMPYDITPITGEGSALVDLAKQVVAVDHFRSGALKGEPAAVKQWVDITIRACFSKGRDESGKKANVLRLTSRPEQRFWSVPPAASKLRSDGLIHVDPGVSSSQSGLYRVGGGVSAPVPLNNVQPHYSPAAKKARVQGFCLIGLIVDADGLPQDVRVTKSLEPGLDLNAVDAVKTYRFQPAMKDGGGVPVRITVEVRFRLY
jgi:TonB family protein